MKGIASIVEVVVTGMILVLAFYYFFPQYTIKSNWSKMLLEIKVKDVLNTIDRLEKTYELATDDVKFESFMEKIFNPAKAEILVSWKDVQGLISDVKVACYGCDSDDISNLNSWLSGYVINDRTTTFSITDFTDFNDIPDSNVLLIYGDTLPVATELDPNKNLLKNYLSSGKGIVEVGDVTNEDQIGDVQKEIFGLAHDGADLGSIDYDIVLKPPLTRIFGLYYYFYNIPQVSKTTGTSVISCDVLLSDPNCGKSALKGKFILMGGQMGGVDEYSFWIYGSSVYLDADKDGDADSVLSVGQTFTLETQLNYDQDFKLKSIGTDSIYISFIPDFRFDDMLKPGSNKVRQVDGDDIKIFIETDTDIPVVIANASLGRTVWTPYLPKKDMSDDERLLLASSLIWTADRAQRKGTAPSFTSGYRQTMVDVVGGDIMEMYRFSLGLGYPF